MFLFNFIYIQCILFAEGEIGAQGLTGVTVAYFWNIVYISIYTLVCVLGYCWKSWAPG